MFEELWDISKTITSHALDTNVSWPNCTVPHFDTRSRHGPHSRAGNPEKDVGLEFVGFAPFVMPEDQAGWEAYAIEHQGWLAQDYYYRGWDEIPPPIPSRIHRYNASASVEEFEEEMFQYQIPLWQMSPTPKNTSMINLDLATVPIFAHLLWDVKVKKVEQYGRVLDLAFLLNQQDSKDYDAENDDPRGTIYQPVFEDFREDAEVVGFMMGTMSWDRMLPKNLFNSSKSILVEIEGDCSAVFTYKISNTELAFLGYSETGDTYRNAKYDQYKQSADLLTPLGSRAGYPPVNHTHRSTDASHNASHCTYVMNTYPTDDFVDVYYQTNEPIYFGVASIFMFSAMVFLAYDLLVERRQAKLMSTAQRANAVVSSLFPKEVKDRMMEEAEVPQGRNSGKKNKSAMVDFVERQGDGDDDTEQDFNKTHGKPLAELYPEATIMVGYTIALCFPSCHCLAFWTHPNFLIRPPTSIALILSQFADIAGFTAWSRPREPSDVFTL